MNDWTCPYCRAHNTTGRCAKCGAFFEDEFDDVIEEESFPEMIDNIFEEKHTQATETKIKTVKGTFPVTRRRRKKTQVFGVKMEPLLVGAIMIMLVFAFTQSSLFREIPQVNFDEPDEPLFQLAIYAVWANKSNYNGIVEILARGLCVERFVMEDGIYLSDLIFNTNAELEFIVYDTYGYHFERVCALSFEDKADWEPRIYTGYPVILELSENW